MLLTNIERKEGSLLFAVFFLVIYEDFFRKFIPGNPQSFFLVKDILLILLYALFFIEVNKNRKFLLNSPIFVPLLMFFLYELLSIFWVNNFSILVFINGIKIDFFYVPLIFIVPYFMNNEKYIYKLCKLIYFSILVIFFLQIFQIFFPGIANSLPLYTLDKDYGGVFHTGHYFRGGNFIEYYKTYFFSGGKMSDMLFNLYVLFLILSLYIGNIKSKKFLALTFILYFMLIMSGKRIFIIFFTLFIFIFIFILYKYSNRAKILSKELHSQLRRLKIYFTFFIISAPIVLIILYFSYAAVATMIDFIFEAMSSGLIERFFITDANGGESFFRLIQKDDFWYGQGVGTNTQGSPMLVSNFKDLYPQNFEKGYFKLINEIGFIGLIFFIIYISSVFILDLNAIFINKIINYKIISIIIMTYHFISLFRYLNGHQFFGSSQTVFFFWFLMGMQIFIYYKGRNNEKKNINIY
jgi:hypothetical protein